MTIIMVWLQHVTIDRGYKKANSATSKFLENPPANRGESGTVKLQYPSNTANSVSHRTDVNGPITDKGLHKVFSFNNSMNMVISKS